MQNPIRPARPDFTTFYRDHFLPEHRHPANRALHVFGTVASAGYLAGALLSPLPWLAVLYPVVHAAPGLFGHRLFERDAAVGDIRILRKDFPRWWFVIANHVLTFTVLRAALARGAAAFG